MHAHTQTHRCKDTKRHTYLALLTRVDDTDKVITTLQQHRSTARTTGATSLLDWPAATTIATLTYALPTNSHMTCDHAHSARTC